MKAILIDTNLFLNQKEVNINDLVRAVEVGPYDFREMSKFLDCTTVQPVVRIIPSADYLFADQDAFLNQWPLVATTTPWYGGELVGNLMIARNGNSPIKLTTDVVKTAILKEEITFRVLSSAARPIKPIIVV